MKKSERTNDIRYAWDGRKKKWIRICIAKDSFGYRGDKVRVIRLKDGYEFYIDKSKLKTIQERLKLEK